MTVDQLLMYKAWQLNPNTAVFGWSHAEDIPGLNHQAPGDPTSPAAIAHLVPLET